MALDRLTVFAGNANPKLAQDVVGHLRLPLGRAKVGRFSDGEVMNTLGRSTFETALEGLLGANGLVMARDALRAKT